MINDASEGYTPDMSNLSASKMVAALLTSLHETPTAVTLPAEVVVRIAQLLSDSCASPQPTDSADVTRLKSDLAWWTDLSVRLIEKDLASAYEAGDDFATNRIFQDLLGRLRCSKPPVNHDLPY